MKYMEFELLINSIDPSEFKTYYLDQNETIELLQVPWDSDEYYDIHENLLVSFNLNVNGKCYSYWSSVDYYNSLYQDKKEIRKMYNEIKDILITERDEMNKIISWFDE